MSRQTASSSSLYRNEYTVIAGVVKWGTCCDCGGRCPLFTGMGSGAKFLDILESVTTSNDCQGTGVRVESYSMTIVTSINSKYH